MFEGPSVGATQHAYWLLPGYFLLTAAAFAVGGPALEPLRLTSVLAGMAVLGATASIVRRLGGDRLTVAIAVALLALDPVFVRASLVGRTDLPTLALALVALRLGLDGRIGTEVVAGFSAAAAALIHPLGGVALVLLAARPIWRLPSRPAYAAIGAAIPLLAAAAYVLQDPGSFVQQFGLQLDRKGARGMWDLGFDFHTYVFQYGGGLLGLAPLIGWLVGALGLVAAGRRIPAVWLLFSALGLELIAITLSAEMWYPLFVLPFAFAGVALWIGRTVSRRASAATSRASRLGGASSVITLVIVVALLLAGDLTTLGYRWQSTGPVGRDTYARWSADVARAIPAGSRVLVGGVPDPAWVLLVDRPDVRLRGLLNTPAVLRYYTSHLDDLDYAVIGGGLDPGWVELLATHATAVTTVTAPAGAAAPCGDGWTPCRPLLVTLYKLRPGP